MFKLKTKLVLMGDRFYAGLRRAAPPLVLGALLILAWQLVVSLGHIKPFLLPGPGAVVATLMDSKWQWLSQASVTLLEVLGGFALAAGVGTFLGIVITWSEATRNAVLPFLVFLNSLPKIALAPLFIIWLGYGVMPNMVIAFISAFFPIAINTATGVTEVDPDMLDFARALCVPKWKVFFKIRLPNALPYIFSGLKISTTLAVIGAIVGEFIASTRGLAAIIMNAQGVLATDAILASLVWISAIGLGLFGFVALLQRLLMPWAEVK